MNLSITSQRNAAKFKPNEENTVERTLPYQEELKSNLLKYKLVGPYSEKKGGKIEIDGEIHRFIIRKKGVIFGLQSSLSGHEKMRLIGNKKKSGETNSQYDRRKKDNKLIYMAFKHKVETHQKALEAKARREKEADSFVASDVDKYIKELEKGRTERLTNKLIAYKKKKGTYGRDDQYSKSLYLGNNSGNDGFVGSIVKFGERVYGGVQDTLSTDRFKFSSNTLLDEDGTTILATTYGWEAKY